MRIADLISPVVKFTRYQKTRLFMTQLATCASAKCVPWASAISTECFKASSRRATFPTKSPPKINARRGCEFPRS